MVKCGLIEERKNSDTLLAKRYLPARVVAGSLVEKVGGDFVRV